MAKKRTVKGVTSTGFQYEVELSRIDNMEFIERIADLADMEENGKEIVATIKLMEDVLGENQKKRLYNHVRTDEGNAPILAVSKEFEEILQAAGANIGVAFTDEGDEKNA